MLIIRYQLQPSSFPSEAAPENRSTPSRESLSLLVRFYAFTLSSNQQVADPFSPIADVTEFHATEEALRESHLEKARLLASETAAKEASRLK